MRRLLPMLASALLLVLVPTTATAITGGEVDTEDRYPFVGLLAFYDDEGEYLHRCTGTLLSSTVVLTASHCTEGTASAYAYFQVSVPEDFRENPTGVAGTPYTHPDYNPNTLQNDVAVVILDEPVHLSEYAVLADEGFLTDLRRDGGIRDATFVVVGYGGVTASKPPAIEYDYLRRFAESTFRGLLWNNLHLHQNPVAQGGSGGTCFGDSGGPTFWDDTLTIVSVTSWGDAICRSNSMTQRLDIASVLDWLDQWV